MLCKAYFKCQILNEVIESLDSFDNLLILKHLVTVSCTFHLLYKTEHMYLDSYMSGLIVVILLILFQKRVEDDRPNNGNMRTGLENAKRYLGVSSLFSNHII